MGAITLMLILGFVGMRECKVGREERVEVVVASYSGEMEQLLRQAVREGKQRRAVSLVKRLVHIERSLLLTRRVRRGERWGP